jgi:hypothetical protein
MSDITVEVLDRFLEGLLSTGNLDREAMTELRHEFDNERLPQPDTLIKILSKDRASGPSQSEGST